MRTRDVAQSPAIPPRPPLDGCESKSVVTYSYCAVGIKCIGLGRLPKLRLKMRYVTALAFCLIALPASAEWVLHAETYNNNDLVHRGDIKSFKGMDECKAEAAAFLVHLNLKFPGLKNNAYCLTNSPPPTDYTPRYRAMYQANVYASNKGWTDPVYFGSYASIKACYADAGNVQQKGDRQLEKKLKKKLVNRQNFHSTISCELIDDTVEGEGECDGC